MSQLLLQEDFEKGLSQIGDLPARKVINPLFSFLCSLDELLKWRAVTAMGEVVTRLAEEDMESARVVMRRYMWHLNDESGGIGWGCPESMGEVMARNENLATEFWCILISYIRPDGNFLEHEVLQRGVLWGVGRFRRLSDSIPAVRGSLPARTGSLGQQNTAQPKDRCHTQPSDGGQRDVKYFSGRAPEAMFGRPTGTGSTG